MLGETCGHSKILLDTPFLLPMLSFETNTEVNEAMPKLHNYDVYYNDISILEVLWKCPLLELCGKVF